MTYGLKEMAADIAAGRLMLTEKELQAERLKVCSECPSYRKMLHQCALCGCIVDLKVKALQATCPVEKW